MSEANSVFQQIADRFRWEILSGTWSADARLPSIRETAVESRVNPNTVVKSYAELEREGIIYKKRGLGYFVASSAARSIERAKRDDFLKRELPRIFDQLAKLDISPDELRDLYEEHQTSRKSHEN